MERYIFQNPESRREMDKIVFLQRKGCKCNHGLVVTLSARKVPWSEKYLQAKVARGVLNSLRLLKLSRNKDRNVDANSL